MASMYLKLFVDCLEKYEGLNDTEFGRLVRAGLRYKATGEQADNMGRESLVWPSMRLDIDRDNEQYKKTVASRSEAGKKGAIERWQNDGKNSKCHLPYGKNGKDKDKEEDKDKEKEKESIEKKTGGPSFPTRHKYGQYGNVLLSDMELDKLKNEFSDWQARVERLSEYVASTGKHYKSHLATIRAWARKDAEASAAAKPIQKVQRHDDTLTQFEKDAVQRLLARQSEEGGQAQ